MSTAPARIHRSFWIDRAPRRKRNAPLERDARVDLAVVGGGYTGLWTALHAKKRNPDAKVLLIEGNGMGEAASGRNGGFVEPSITHGLSNGLTRWPNEIDEIVRISKENFAGMHEDIVEHGIECDWVEGGTISFARTPWQAEALEEAAADATAHGIPTEYIGAGRIGEFTKSPQYIAALRDAEVATIDPYKLAIGLLHACEEAGVEVVESTRVTNIDAPRDADVVLHTAGGAMVHAKQVALGTNAYPSLLKRLSLTTIPVYDYALMTESLSDADFEAIGWTGDEGLSDAGNQFHYYRKSDDGRILWGGYDAIFHAGAKRSEALTQREETFATLERNFRETYPQLAHIQFTHQWGGMIDSSTRFCVTAGTAHQGRIAYAVGYTGLGVAATRFGADVMLDLLSGEPTPRTELEMIRKPALPFPPEPALSLGVQLTRWSMAEEDRKGRRNIWLRTMDALGLGFDS